MKGTNMAEINKLYGLSAKGNEYKKSNSGKKAGMFVGGIIPTVASLIKISQIKDELNFRNCEKAIENAIKAPKGTKLNYFDSFKNLPEKLLTTKNIKTGAIAACAIISSAVVGRFLGNLYDKCINKERMIEADGMAELEKQK